jgi:hypothetical protein
MRLLSLRLGDEQLKLHPLVTVVNGLDPALRARLVEVIAALPAGRAEASGVIEAHGVLLDLTFENLAMLELTSDIDVVVRRDELPGAELSPAAREVSSVRARHDELRAALDKRRAEQDRAELTHAAAAEALADARGGGSEEEVEARRQQRLEAPRLELQRLAAARAAIAAQLEEVRRGLEPGQQTARDAAAARERAQVFRSEAARACSVAAAELDASRLGRDPAALSALEATRQRVIDLESGAADAELIAGTDDGEEDPAAVIERMESRRALLEASLLALDPVDPFPVEAALRQLEDDGGTDLIVSTDAEALADEWADILVELAATQIAEHDALQVQAAHKRLEAARGALFKAESEARLPDLDREQVDALEHAHEAVLQAQDRSEKRLSGDRGKRRLDEARAAEREILDRLGMQTYADFIMGTSMLRVDPEQERQLDEARAELADAEDAIAALDAEVEIELKHAELMTRRRALREKATALLGRDPGDNDVEWALRHHRVAVSDGGERSDRLRAALEHAGLVLGDEDVPRSMLVELATIWLEELRDTEAQRVKVEDELAELATTLERAKSNKADQDEEGGLAELGRRRAAKLEEARKAVAAAEVRVARHQEAEAETERCRESLARLTEIEHQAAADLTAADAAWAEATQLEHDASHRLTAIEADLGAALEAEQGAADAVAAIEAKVAQGVAPEDVDELVATVEAAAERAALATAEVNALEAELATVEARLRELEVTAPAPSSSVATEGELEWYLLARLAAQRSVSYAGSVPLVLDGALNDLTAPALVRVLERLERMAGAVQLIVLSEDQAAAAWATAAGPERAELLR